MGYEIKKEYPGIKTIVPDTVKIFIDEKFPIIATLLLVKYKNKKPNKKIPRGQWPHWIIMQRLFAVTKKMINII